MCPVLSLVTQPWYTTLGPNLGVKPLDQALGTNYDQTLGQALGFNLETQPLTQPWHPTLEPSLWSQQWYLRLNPMTSVDPI